MKQTKFLLPLAVIATLMTTAAIALPTDRQQPVKVQAQKLQASRNTNTSVYIGNVVITQGSLQIRADRVEVHGNDQGEISRVIATGKPAHFQQSVEQTQAPIKARAKRIEFKINADKLLLTGDAHVDRDGNTLSAQRIDYDLASEQIQAQGQSGENRVEMIWKPEANATPQNEPQQPQNDQGNVKGQDPQQATQEDS